MLSALALGYSPDAVFYAKNSDSPEMGYIMFPGMFEATQSSPAAEGKTKVECERGCSLDGAKCQGFSYREHNGICAYTSTPLDYDSAWDYYEKPPREFKRGHPAEVN